MKIRHTSQEPSPLLIRHLPHLPKGKALDIASGFGRNAFYLAERGYEVGGVDSDEEAVRFCNAEAIKRQLPFVARRDDLEGGTLSLGTGFALLSCFYYLDRKLIPKMKAALQVGGVIIYETFLIDQHLQFGKPSRKIFCWEHNELLRSFIDFRILHYYEGKIFPNAPSGFASTENNEEVLWVAQLIAERID